MVLAQVTEGRVTQVLPVAVQNQWRCQFLQHLPWQGGPGGRTSPG